MMIACVSGSENHSERPDLSVIRSLKPDDSSTVNPDRSFGGGQMIGNDARVIARPLPITAVVVIVVVDCLVSPFVLPNPHVANSMRLNDPRHSADRNNFSVKPYVKVVVRTVRLDMSLEVRVNLFVVIAAKSRLVLTHRQSQSQVALVQRDVAIGVVEVIA